MAGLWTLLWRLVWKKHAVMKRLFWQGRAVQQWPGRWAQRNLPRFPSAGLCGGPPLLSVAVFAGHLCARLALALGRGSGVAGTGIADDADVDVRDGGVVGVIAVLVLPGVAVLAVDRKAIVVCEFTDASVGRLSVGRLCGRREAVVERDARESRRD